MTQVDTSQAFGAVGDRAARLYTLENDQFRVRITDYGGILVSVEAPDRDGRKDHVLLGFDDAGAYAAAGGSFGAMLGRCANRIAQGRFTLDGVSYQTSQNDRGSTLHGGKIGFGQQFWSVESATGDRLDLALVSADGDQGFPGQVCVKASYHLRGNALELVLAATTTKATPVSLGTHPYFNLGGSASNDGLAQVITIAATEFLATDADQIPTGERRPVAGTPFDFRTPRAAGDRIREPDTQLITGCGYDHYFVLAPQEPTDGPRLAARVSDPESGRTLEILTTQPGVQFYTGNQLKGTVAGRNGLYRQSAGIAVETHGFPNAINQPDFPSTVLRPGGVYNETTVYRFLVASE